MGFVPGPVSWCPGSSILLRVKYSIQYPPPSPAMMTQCPITPVLPPSGASAHSWFQEWRVHRPGQQEVEATHLPPPTERQTHGPRVCHSPVACLAASHIDSGYRLVRGRRPWPHKDPSCLPLPPCRL